MRDGAEIISYIILTCVIAVLGYLMGKDTAIYERSCLEDEVRISVEVDRYELVPFDAYCIPADNLMDHMVPQE